MFPFVRPPLLRFNDMCLHDSGKTKGAWKKVTLILHPGCHTTKLCDSNGTNTEDLRSFREVQNGKERFRRLPHKSLQFTRGKHIDKCVYNGRDLPNIMLLNIFPLTKQRSNNWVLLQDHSV